MIFSGSPSKITPRNDPGLQIYAINFIFYLLYIYIYIFVDVNKRFGISDDFSGFSVKNYPRGVPEVSKN